jgi:hypothetical protein
VAAGGFIADRGSANIIGTFAFGGCAFASVAFACAAGTVDKSSAT